jgi:hypothetical protein
VRAPADPVSLGIQARVVAATSILFVCLVCSVSAAAQTRATVKKLSDCPLSGAADEGSDHALLIIQKRQEPTDGAKAALIDFNVILDLQRAVEDKQFPMGRGTDLTKEQRQELRGLVDVGGTSVGEGDFVQLVGYIADDVKNPRFNKGESVTCYLTKPVDNDIHINVVADPEEDEFNGIVVEMLPFHRVDSWNLANLRLIRKAHLPVLIRGLLFLDNVHVKRTDCPEDAGGAVACVDRDSNAAGNPARVSLWEIHPVSEFRYCRPPSGRKCDPKKLAQWTPLDTIDPATFRTLVVK